MLGDNIKKARKNKRISQKKLAHDAGVSTSYIQQLELGQKTNPSVEILLKLAKALDVNIKELNPNIPIWEEFDAVLNVDNLRKQTEIVENADKVGKKLIEDIKAMGDIQNDKKLTDEEKSDYIKKSIRSMEEMLGDMNELKEKVNYFNEVARKFIDKEENTIMELVQIYNSTIYETKYDVSKIDKEHYNKLRTKIRNDIEETLIECNK